MSVRVVTVFVSSPSDLKPEREAVKQLCNEFNNRALMRGKYKFEPLLYEEMVPAASGLSPQEIVDRKMMKASNADIVVCMFWERFGTTLPADKRNPDTGEGYGSGTEYEFWDAYRAMKRRGKPELQLYRCTRVNDGMNPDLPKQPPDQLEKVDTFFKRAQSSSLYKSFMTPDGLTTQLAKDWELVIAGWERPLRRFLDRALPLLPLLMVGLVALAAILFATVPRVAGKKNFGFNVAIAGFEADRAAGVTDNEAAGFSDSLYNSFNLQLPVINETLDRQVGAWSPAQVGIVRGADDAKREENARLLVESYRKDGLIPHVIVFGRVTKVDGEFSVEPEFFVVPYDEYADLSDVLGRFKLDKAVSVKGDTTLLSADINKRSKALTFITQGLVYMSLREPKYDAAADVYTKALSVKSDEQTGTELLYLLRANARVGKYNKLSAGGGSATESGTSALLSLITQIRGDFVNSQSADPDFARAYIGLAGSKYLEILEPIAAREAWTEIKDKDLEAIERLYQAALAIPNTPETADIPTKAAFGLAQLHQLRYLRGEAAAWDRATAGFNQVITNYGSGKNPRVKELAAQAWGYIGLLIRQKGETDKASAAYTQAIEISTLSSRQALFRRAVLQMDFDQKRAEITLYDATKEPDKRKTAIDDAVKAADALFDLKGLPRDKAITMYHKGKMLSEVDQPQDALTAYLKGIRVLDNGVIDVTEKELAATLYAVAADKQLDLNQNSAAIDAYSRALELDPKGQAHLSRVIQELKGAPVPTPATPIMTPTGAGRE